MPGGKQLMEFLGDFGILRNFRWNSFKTIMEFLVCLEFLEFLRKNNRIRLKITWNPESMKNC
jgi:hypothetical protein